MRVGIYWHVFPTYKDAKDTVWRDPAMLFNIIPERYIKSKNDTELIVYFKNGSMLQLKGADNPDSLRGPNPFGVVFDEYATMKREAWDVVEPVLRANGGWCWFVGTPKGKNHMFEMYQRGQEGNKEWKSWLLKASTSGIIDLDQLIESKKTSHSEAFYNQEWECEFLEGEGSVFRGVRDVMTSVPEKPKPNHLYVMGVDLAKVQDYTVITIYDRQNNKQVYQNRWNTIEWPYQKKKIIETSRHYNNALTVLDATGLGDPIADDLIRFQVPVKAFKITSESKKDLIEKLSIWIEQGKLQMLPIAETSFEFDNFSYEIGPTGKIRYQALEGFHDDIVISHALAVSELQPLVLIKPRPELNLVKLAFQRAKKENEEIPEDQWLE